MRALAAMAVAAMLVLAGCSAQEAPRHREDVVFAVSDRPLAEAAAEPEAAPEDAQAAEAEPEPVLEQEAEPVQHEEPDTVRVEEAEPDYGWYGDVNGHLTRSQFSTMGVFSDGRFEYRWYSSNVLYHMDTWQWHTDSEGYWRTDDGYLVVASSDYPIGTELCTDALGPMRVLDTGCASGTVDVYVSW